MTGPGDYGSEMERFQGLSDREAESLLAGRAPASGGDLSDLAVLIEGVKAATVRPLDREVEERHLAAIKEALHLEGSRDSAIQGKRRATRRRSMIAGLLAPLWAKIAVAAGAAVLATGGLAAADVLPQPAQDAVASAAERIGLELPSSEDGEEVEAVEEEGPEDEGSPPEHAEGKSVSEDVHAVLEDDSLEGRDKGEAVADAASQNRQDAGRNPTGFGPDNHPTGPPEGSGEGDEEVDGQSNNPTGYGPDNHPTGKPEGVGPPR